MSIECALKNIGNPCYGENLPCRCCHRNICCDHRRDILFSVTAVCHRCIAFNEVYTFIGTKERAS